MNTPVITPPVPALHPAAPEPRRYEPPRLTGKQALEQVTLFSSTPCTPGTPGCSIGHP
jgi:hypothetical protein